MVIVFESTHVQLEGTLRLNEKRVVMLIGSDLDQCDRRRRFIILNTRCNCAAGKATSENEIICHGYYCCDERD